MRTPFVATVTILVVCLLTACRSEPVPTVQPVDAPLPAAAASSDIVPIEKVVPSQAGAVAQRVANTEITITYSRPVARGRELFGALVPYEQVWNPGADRATAISVSRDVEVNGQALEAGSYSIWAIPRADR